MELNKLQHTKIEILKNRPLFTIQGRMTKKNKIEYGFMMYIPDRKNWSSVNKTYCTDTQMVPDIENST